MKKLISILLALLISSSMAFAKETVLKEGGDIEGRIQSYSDGILIIKQNGADSTLIRTKNDDFFGDFIQYRKTPFTKELVDVYCRVILIDLYSVMFETPTSRISVPRYRVKNLVLNYKLGGN